MGFYQWFDKQSQVVKIILLIPFWGWIFSLLYRLDKFIENRDVASLIGFILCLVVGFFMAIIDLITVATDNKITILVHGGENFGINGTVDDLGKTKEETEEAKEQTEETKEESKEE